MDAFIKITQNSEGISFETQDLPVLIRNSNGKWTVFSPIFKTIGYSNESEQKAFEDFQENLGLFFQIHYEDDTLENALMHQGWKPYMFHQNKVSPSFRMSTNDMYASKRQNFVTPVYA